MGCAKFPLFIFYYLKKIYIYNFINLWLHFCVGLLTDWLLLFFFFFFFFFHPFFFLSFFFIIKRTCQKEKKNKCCQSGKEKQKEKKYEQNKISLQGGKHWADSLSWSNQSVLPCPLWLASATRPVSSARLLCALCRVCACVWWEEWSVRA